MQREARRISSVAHGLPCCVRLGGAQLWWFPLSSESIPNAKYIGNVELPRSPMPRHERLAPDPRVDGLGSSREAGVLSRVRIFAPNPCLGRHDLYISAAVPSQAKRVPSTGVGVLCAGAGALYGHCGIASCPSAHRYMQGPRTPSHPAFVGHEKSQWRSMSLISRKKLGMSILSSLAFTTCKPLPNS